MSAENNRHLSGLVQNQQSQPRSSRELARSNLIARQRELHAERVEAGLQLIALSYADSLELLAPHCHGRTSEAYVLEIEPSDSPVKNVETAISNMNQLGYSLEEVIGNPETGKIYAIFQKNQRAQRGH